MLAPGHDESFALDDAQLAEIEERMARADLGEVEPARSVLDGLRITEGPQRRDPSNPDPKEPARI